MAVKKNKLSGLAGTPQSEYLSHQKGVCNREVPLYYEVT